MEYELKQKGGKVLTRRVKLLLGLMASVSLFALGQVSPNLFDFDMLSGNYTVSAKFDDVGELKAGDSVTIAGIRVGHVDSVTLDGGTAVVVLRVKRDIVIEDDSIASIKTKGLMGGKYVQISPGGSEKLLKQGGSIIDTESAMDPERLISKYVFGKV